MFSEIDEINRFSLSDFESMTDTLFPPTHLTDFCHEATSYSPCSDDYAVGINCSDERMMDLDDDLLLPQYIKFDIEKQPQLLNLVSPNDILPVDTSLCLETLAETFNRATYGSEIFSTMFQTFNKYEDIPEVTDMPPSPVVPEGFGQLCGDDQFLVDKLMNEFSKDGASLDNIIEEDILPCLEQNNIESNDSVHSDSVHSDSVHSDSAHSTDGTMSRITYHPDYDHCYSKLNDDKDDIWTSAGSPDSSGSSSEEVDVVTVTEELQAPFVPKVQVPFRKRQKRGQKSQKGKKNQNSLSPKTFNAAMKRNMTRITTIRRTYRRKINNSVETTPSNSLPSSAPSSRCSSDVEDAGKRANHNSSERKRREVLRTALQNLRLCVPGVQNNLKAPKVQILNCAKEFIGEACQKDQEYRIMKKNLKSKRRFLEMKLKSLRAEMNLS